MAPKQKPFPHNFTNFVAKKKEYLCLQHYITNQDIEINTYDTLSTICWRKKKKQEEEREPLTQVYCHTAFLFMSSIPTFPVLDLCFHGNIRLSPILYGLQSVIGHTFRIWTNSIIRLMCTCVFLFCAVCKMGLETHMRSYFFIHALIILI